MDEDLDRIEPIDRRSRLPRALPLVAGVAVALVASSVVVGVTNRAQLQDGVLTDGDRVALEQYVHDNLSAASSKQQEMAARGSIDEADLLELASDASRCAVDAGAPPIEYEWTRDGFVTGQDYGGYEPDEMIRLLDVTDDCWEQHVGAIELMKALDLVPPEDEQRRFNAAVAACLTDAGEDGDGWPVVAGPLDPVLEARCVDTSREAAARR